MSDHAHDPANDPKEQISELREQVQRLMNERAAPALSQAADSAKHYAHEAREIYEDQTEVLSEKVREAPVVAVLIAAGVGYILGRIAR